MDIHTEDSLEFDDGGIEVDLRSTGEHDDLSLQDAGTDVGQDVQPVPEDQDDFMADNDDPIQEDSIDVDFDGMGQPGPTDRSASPEEDLIDYSDDEDAAPTAAAAHQHDIDHSAVAVEHVDQTQAINTESLSGEGRGEDEATAEAAANINIHGVLDSAEDQDEQPQQWQDADHFSSQEPTGTEHDVPEEAQVPHNDYHDAEGTTGDPTVNHSAPATHADGISNEQNSQEAQEINLHPVNVHFDGHDYWLFKHDDYDDSGDYLLDDEAYFTQPIHIVIDACRRVLLNLGSDISNELELGFRLDSLCGLELFQDYPMSHMFRLNQFLRIYLQLHAQDGVTEPDYFCVSLVSRPRMYAQLSELMKATEEGIGFSGLHSAIAAGLSGFNNHFSHSPEQDHAGWASGDEQEYPEAQTSPQAVQEVGGEEYTHEEVPVGEAEVEQDLDTALDHDTKTAQDELAFELESEKHTPKSVEEAQGEDTSEDAARNDPKVAAAAGTPSNKVANEDSTTIANEGDEKLPSNPATDNVGSQDADGDLLDYSDGEDDKSPENEVQTTRTSSESATVQGDDLAFNELQGGAVGEVGDAAFDGQADEGDETFAGHEDPQYEGYEYDGQEYDGEEYAGQEEYDGQEEYNGQEYAGEEYDGEEHAGQETNGQEYVGHDTNGHEHEDYEYPYGEGDAQEQEEDYNQDYSGDQEFGAYPAYDVLQNHELTNNLQAGQHPVDGPDDTHVHSGSNAGELDAAGEFDAAVDAFDGANDAFEFDDTAATAQLSQDQQDAEDEIDYSDEEDGAAGQAQVAPLAAADTVAATSSSGLQTLSPQGQKRTIDEVGNDAGHASNSAGMFPNKRFTLSSSNAVLISHIGAKRPRV